MVNAIVLGTIGRDALQVRVLSSPLNQQSFSLLEITMEKPSIDSVLLGIPFGALASISSGGDILRGSYFVFAGITSIALIINQLERRHLIDARLETDMHELMISAFIGNLIGYMSAMLIWGIMNSL